MYTVKVIPLNNQPKRRCALKEPDGCKNCKRDQCPLHCEHLDARIKAKGVSVSSAPAAQNQDEIKMAGTF